MTRDVLRFYQAYINEMFDIGGENLPKSISTRLGAKLARSYKQEGIQDIEFGIKTLFGGMNARTKVVERDRDRIEITAKYRKRFCPVGGMLNPEQAEKTQEMICRPYILGFLNELDPQFKYHAESKQCILESNGKTCSFILKTERKHGDASNSNSSD